ncbi:MAG TPA: DUF3592 domain-containing protein [Leptospiraceae bacterium]|nr:DUF3592 domain-containing protein [Leptospiraceae bacterium]HNF53020.1 DUF3592 domain-containing protein [Leptospiraceae bacterium]HNH53732.1 DUF3592 domain-containing protein [Leptospiraceae bacterium]HNK57842.1 DUF3592 domain-containing protein [Leptospiraceae bacterium]HNK95987.1 DUF3592 domain-containing protein [Leptospiraceae bacterium]
MQITKGKIIESKVEKLHEYRSVYLGHYDFKRKVVYEYEVEGEKYISDRISFHNYLYNSGKKAEAAIHDYPLNKEIIVYYRENDPKDSYLEVEDDTLDE